VKHKGLQNVIKSERRGRGTLAVSANGAKTRLRQRKRERDMIKKLWSEERGKNHGG